MKQVSIVLLKVTAAHMIRWLKGDTTLLPWIEALTPAEVVTMVLKMRRQEVADSLEPADRVVLWRWLLTAEWPATGDVTVELHRWIPPTEIRALETEVMLTRNLSLATRRPIPSDPGSTGAEAPASETITSRVVPKV